MDADLRRDRGRGPARRDGAVRPHAAADVQGRPRRSRVRHHRRARHRAVGHQGARRPANRCGACSADATGGCPPTPPAWTSASTDDELVAAYQAYAEHGLRAAKLKGGLDIERDRHRLTLVRDVLAEAGHGSRPGLMLDANEAWTRKQAVRHVCELERTLDLIWIEEPVRRWDAEGLAAVGRGIRASVATGENLTGLEQFRPLLGRGRGRHRADGRGLGGDPLPAGRRPGPRPRPAGQPDRHHPGRAAARRDVGAQPPGQRAAGPAAAGRRLRVDLHVEDGAFILGDSPGLGHPASTRRRSTRSPAGRTPGPRKAPTSGRSTPDDGCWRSPAASIRPSVMRRSPGCRSPPPPAGRSRWPASGFAEGS